jgi:hypothetical protein
MKLSHQALCSPAAEWQQTRDDRDGIGPGLADSKAILASDAADGHQWFSNKATRPAHHLDTHNRIRILLGQCWEDRAGGHIIGRAITGQSQLAFPMRGKTNERSTAENLADPCGFDIILADMNTIEAGLGGKRDAIVQDQATVRGGKDPAQKNCARQNFLIRSFFVAILQKPDARLTELAGETFDGEPGLYYRARIEDRVEQRQFSKDGHRRSLEPVTGAPSSPRLPSQRSAP